MTDDEVQTATNSTHTAEISQRDDWQSVDGVRQTIETEPPHESTSFEETNEMEVKAPATPQLNDDSGTDVRAMPAPIVTVKVEDCMRTTHLALQCAVNLHCRPLKIIVKKLPADDAIMLTNKIRQRSLKRKHKPKPLNRSPEEQDIDDNRCRPAKVVIKRLRKEESAPRSNQMEKPCSVYVSRCNGAILPVKRYAGAITRRRNTCIGLTF